MQAPVVPMSFLRAKPIGVMQMIDQGEQDDKIIAVHADDPEFRDYDDINQLPKHRLAEIRRWALQSRLSHAPNANMSLVALNGAAPLISDFHPAYHAVQTAQKVSLSGLHEGVSVYAMHQFVLLKC